MTVAELIETLKRVKPDTKLYIHGHRGYNEVKGVQQLPLKQVNSKQDEHVGSPCFDEYILAEPEDETAVKELCIT